MSVAWGPEDTVQVEILAWLETEMPDAIVYHVPNGGYRTLATARKLKRLGVMPGVPDITVLLPRGRIVFIEVKAPKGVLSAEQKGFRSKAEGLNHTVIVARSVEDVRAGFSSLNVAWAA